VSAEPLERLHALLVEAVRRRRGGDPHGSPVTIAEIYQELVPYRRVRAAVGLDMNADYEHTLLRLLSGEGRLTKVEPAAAREQMERELESPNPNVALYRKFAGCDVWLLPSTAPTPSWVTDHLAEEEAQAEPPVPEPSPVAAVSAAAPSEMVELETLAEAPAAGAEHVPQPEPPQNMNIEQEQKTAGASPARGRRATAVVEAGHCAFCDSGLPAGRQVRFCPFCGADQSQRPCAVCAEPVQQEWAYCIACGEPVAGEDA
jgi:hypothetical protein